MILIVCPFCGPRGASEFSYLGERRVRPMGPTAAENWRAYLYDQANVAGWRRERWFHLSGCRRFLEVERHTISHEIRSIRATGSPAPREGDS